MLRVACSDGGQVADGPSGVPAQSNVWTFSATGFAVWPMR